MNVKTFRVVGEVRKPNAVMPFNLKVRDVKAENAIERVLSELGGRYKAKRYEIKIKSVKEELQQHEQQ